MYIEKLYHLAARRAIIKGKKLEIRVGGVFLLALFLIMLLQRWFC